MKIPKQGQGQITRNASSSCAILLLSARFAAKNPRNCPIDVTQSFLIEPAQDRSSLVYCYVWSMSL